MPTKILITGAAGFIGSTLVQNIINNTDFEVWALDNNFRYNFEFLEAIKSPRLHIIKADICDAKKIEEVFGENFDFIAHLAAIPGERLCKKYPDETIKTNIYGTKVVLDQALKCSSIKNIIFASSQVIYGYPKDFPLTENSACAPYDLYSYSKAADEMLLEIYRQKKLPITTVRFSSVYGHGMFARWDEIMGRFIKLANEGNVLTIYKAPNLDKAGIQKVDLINVNDVASALLKIIESTPKTVGKAYNISYGSSVSILDLAEIVKDISKKKLNKDLNFETVETQEEEMPKIEVSNEKIKNEIGWQPKISLEMGMAELFEKYSWYKQKYGVAKEPAVIKTPTRYSS